MTSGKCKMGIVVLVAAFSLMLTLYAVLSSSSFPNSANPENSPVTIRLETDKSIYTLGETVKVKFYLINHKNETVNLVGSISANYEVINSKGESIYGVARFYELHEEYPIVLPAQSELLFPFETFEWDQKTITITDSGYNLTDAGPGTYTIKVTVDSSSGMFHSEIAIEIKR